MRNWNYWYKHTLYVLGPGTGYINLPKIQHRIFKLVRVQYEYRCNASCVMMTSTHFKYYNSVHLSTIAFYPERWNSSKNNEEYRWRKHKVEMDPLYLWCQQRDCPFILRCTRRRPSCPEPTTMVIVHTIVEHIYDGRRLLCGGTCTFRACMDATLANPSLGRASRPDYTVIFFL